MEVPPARQDSIENIIHTALDGAPAALFVFDGGESPAWAARSRGHRAVGVVYSPKADRWGSYALAVLGRRYDAFLWFDETAALEPLHGVKAHGAEAETWLSGR